jgi:hypothetical protein
MQKVRFIGRQEFTVMPYKQLVADFRLEIRQHLAGGGLADEASLGCAGNAAGDKNLVKYP